MRISDWSSDVRSSDLELGRSMGSVPVPRLEDTQVRLFGDLAVVTGVAVYQGTSGTPESRPRFTEVWVKRAGRWPAVPGHYKDRKSDVQGKSVSVRVELGVCSGIKKKTTAYHST